MKPYDTACGTVALLCHDLRRVIFWGRYTVVTGNQDAGNTPVSGNL